MKKLNKYILLTGCCVGAFIALDAMAADYDCASINNLCTDLGYTTYKGTCTGGFMLCPFDSTGTAAVCDQEADTGDYKFSRGSGGSGWSTPTSVYMNKFIVGAGNTSYCGMTSIGSSYSSTIKSHTHSGSCCMKASYPNAFIVKVDQGDGVGEGSKNFYTYASSTSKSFATKTTTTTIYHDTKTNTDDTYPIHKVVAFYTYSNPNQKYTGSAGAIPDSEPKCQDLGYIDKTSNCPGAYVRCPMDPNAVMCDMQAKAGEIKFSLQAENHDGWLLADGSTLTGVWAKSELKTLLGSTTLPNYKGVFFKTGSSSSDTVVKDGLKGHTHTLTWTASNYPTGTSSYKKSGDKDDYYAIKEGATITETLDADGYIGFVDHVYKSETVPPHYVANVFIYSGKLN